MSSHPLDCTPGDEEYPLLKMAEPAAGEGGRISSKVWTISSSRRKSWRNRWPEFMSACWMSLILLGICFLAIYTLGLAMSRRQAIMLQYLKTANKPQVPRNPLLESPKSKVFYVQILDQPNLSLLRGHQEYFTQMALSYPNLHFDIIYLNDDTVKYSPFHGLRRGRFFNKIIPNTNSCKNQDSLKKAISDFEKKFTNVNASLMPLSSYMNNTPLKNNWRTMSMCLISFYVRIYSVWQQGGIGLDLPTFYNKYLKHETINHKIVDIFAKHNKGISNQEHITTTEVPIENKTKNDLAQIFSYFTYIFDKAYNESFSIMDQSFSWTTVAPSNESSKVLSRVHRSKREALEPNKLELQEMENKPNNTDTILTINSTKADNFNVSKETEIEDNTNETINISPINITSVITSVKNDSNIWKYKPPKFFFYDFFSINDNFGPSYLISDTLTPEYSQKVKDFSKQVAVDIDGKFIAAYNRHHPFLSRFLSFPLGTITIHSFISNECYSYYSHSDFCDNILLI